MKDGSGESNDTDTINLTIQVKDLDEHPVITGKANEQHDENDEGTVLTLSANDPERVTPIHWDFLEDASGTQDLPGGVVGDDIDPADVADHASFDIENGVLTFADGPNFEGESASGNGNDFYQVVVKASDGGLTNWVQYFEITVEVLDLEEEGEVDWTVDGDGDGALTDQTPNELLEFQADAILTASVTDPDGPDTLIDVTWQWYRSTSSTGGWTAIAGADANTYTVQDDVNDDDVGKYLQVVARYTDRRGANKMAEKISDHKVRTSKVNDNSLPEFAPTEHNRRIQESSAAGTVVGGPVTATDADGDVLNYTLPEDVNTNNTWFQINQATGQITRNSTPLDYETPGTNWTSTTVDGVTTLTFNLMVRATDSAGGQTGGGGADDTDDATVTVTLLNVNEAPDFGTEARETAGSEANISGMAPDRHEETTTTMPTALRWNARVSSYTATDPEGVALDGSKWSLSGDDAGEFKLTGTVDGDEDPGVRGSCRFREPCGPEPGQHLRGDGGRLRRF